MENEKTELKMIRMSEIETQEIKWLWYPFIPYGKLTIVQGDPGDGKTTMILNLAAQLSKGKCFEEGSGVDAPMKVIYQTAEDGLADTVKPRLEKADADCEQILVIDESDKSLSMIDERIEETLQANGAKMLILDPIQAYLGGGMGSIDFFAVARSVLLVGRVEGEPNIRAVVQIKNNLAEFGHPKAFRLSDEGFEWMGDYDITVDEVLGGIAPKANKLEQAKRLLMELAENNNMMLSSEILELATEEDISKRTMETAKKELGIKAKKNQQCLVLDTGRFEAVKGRPQHCNVYRFATLQDRKRKVAKGRHLRCCGLEMKR